MSPLIAYPWMRFEDPALMAEIERILIKRRGFAFRMPHPGSPALLSLSGGLDTTLSAAILMEEWGLKIWPYFVYRGQRAEKAEEESVRFFTDWFNKRYPGQFQPVMFITCPNPPHEIKKPISGFTYPLRDTIFFSLGIQYATALEQMRKAVIRTIFCGYVVEEAALDPRNTLTTLRSYTLHACAARNDFRWQITALPLERALGYYFGKRELIQWAAAHDIPVERTRSCIEAGAVHCGTCWCCVQRKHRFLAAGVPDPTEYLE